MIPVMLFVDGPAEGLMLSTSKQLYTVGLYQMDEFHGGYWMCAIYAVFGSDPAYGGARQTHEFPMQGVYTHKGNKKRKASLIDGYLADLK